MSVARCYHQYEHFLSMNHWEQKKYSHGIFAEKKMDAFRCSFNLNYFDSGLLLSRIQGDGEGAFHSHIEQIQHHLSIVVVLSGRHRFLSSRTDVAVNSEQIWLVQGDFENIDECTAGENGNLSVVAIDYSLARIQEWQEQGILSKTNDLLKWGRETHIKKLADNIFPIKHFAQQLLNIPYQGNTLSHLELEIATLSLTEKLLKVYVNDVASTKQRRQIDEVIDIIYVEFEQALTISSLARRVGMNECYLKRYFKAQTGETVAQFIRRLRLEKALDMLSQGNKSIKETMFFVGYNSIEHFNKIFKQQFGFLPKQVR